MGNILSLETSTEVCAVALFQNNVLLGETRLSSEKAHSKSLASMTKQLLSAHDISPNQLHAVAISSGPGSYTGLRIGTSFAKGICFSMDVPLIAIPTLDGMIAQARIEDELVAYCPMIDARRMEVYCKVESANGEELIETHAHVVDETSFNDILENGKVLFFGDGAGKSKDVLQHQNAVYLDSFEMSALGIGILAFSKFEKKAFENMAYFEPFYLKEYKAGKPKPMING